MFHLHTSFDLSPEVNINDYRATLNQFSTLMRESGLIVETGPVMERCRHPIMDTDEDRGHRSLSRDERYQQPSPADVAGEPGHKLEIAELEASTGKLDRTS